MTPTDPTPLDPNGSAARLAERERNAIRQAPSESSHPFVAIARGLLDDWDELADDDWTAGLLLFAKLTRSPERQREARRGMGR